MQLYSFIKSVKIYNFLFTKGQNKMKKIISVILAATLLLTSLFVLTSCSGSNGKITIAVPSDTTNEARALLLLQEQGLITLKEDAGITATVRDIVENPYNIEFKESEAAQLPNVLQDVDYAVINSNYAIDAGIDPISQSLAMEGSSSAYSNVLRRSKSSPRRP